MKKCKCNAVNDETSDKLNKKYICAERVEEICKMKGHKNKRLGFQKHKYTK